MTRVRSLVSVLMGAMLSTGAVACSKDKAETQAEPVAEAEPAGEPETGQADRPVPSLPAPADGVEPAEAVAPEANAATEPAQDRRRGRRGERRAAMLEKFDQNQDGQIDDTERAAMRSARAAQMIARFDGDGDGSLSRDELAAVEGRGRRRSFDIAKADANGDGAVSAAELETHMTERMAERMRRRGGPASEDAEAGEGAAEPQ